MRCKNKRSRILEIKFRFDMGLQLEGRDLSSEGFLRRGVTEAVLKRVGNIPSEKERLAR